MNLQFAKRMSHVTASEIRELLKLADQPDIISFAGGFPAPELFPVDSIIDVSTSVLEEDGQRALQYTSTEGVKPLRKWIAVRMNRQLGIDLDEDNILILHGSQQALDLAGKVFLDEGDIVLCESPTYLAAINAFRAYGAKFIEVPCDDNGMIIEEVEKIIETTEGIRLIYAIPTFQNPTGRTWSRERREALAKLSAKHNLPVLEDNPYGELRFEGEHLPSIKTFDQLGNVLYAGTFSKIFCPGYRIGWIAGDKDLIRQFVLVKQSTDLQCNTLAQMQIAKYVTTYNIDDHIAGLIDVYRRRRDIALRTMEEVFPKCVRFTRPEGGLFNWIVLPKEVNAREVLEECLKQKVAFVPGGSFFPNGGNENTFRLNFSNMPEEKIVTGIKTLGKVLHQFITE